MSNFHYRATDTSGEEKEGSFEADSLQAARDALVAMGLSPIEVYESAGPAVDALQLEIREPSEASPPPIPEPEAQPTSEAEVVYFPFIDTLRLYAGWLLAWYCIVYAIGSYQFMKELPFRIPYAESLFLSPLVLSFTFAAYLFLLLSGFYKSTGRKKLIGLISLIIGVVLFVLYRMNVQ